MSKAIVVAGDGTSSARRRQWPAELKRRIVEESFKPESSVSQVARAYDVNANQVFSWRRQFQRGVLDEPGKSATLLPVRIVGDIANDPASQDGPRVPDNRSTGTIQIEIGRGRVRIEGTPDPCALRIVLDYLRG